MYLAPIQTHINTHTHTRKGALAYTHTQTRPPYLAEVVFTRANTQYVAVSRKLTICLGHMRNQTHAPLMHAAAFSLPIHTPQGVRDRCQRATP